MGKAKCKPRPSMPDWYWWWQDGCWFCKNKNNCNQCKANRSASKQFPKLKKEEALVLMDHGTGHFADSAYAALDYRFKSLGADNVFVGTVEGYPEIEDVRRQLRAYGPRKVILLPLMVVAGDHAVNDMAGEEEDSWKSLLKQDGFETECILKGLGEFPEIQDMYVQHIFKAVAK